jgi:hypothetical protein
MGLCLANAPPKTLSDCGPVLGKLGRKLAPAILRQDFEVWDYLFRCLCRADQPHLRFHRDEALAATFVDIGEQIVRFPAVHNGVLESATALANLNRGEMWRHHQKLAFWHKLPFGGRKAAPPDPQAKAFRRIVGDAAGLKARGRFAAVCYRKPDAQLAETFLAFSDQASADGLQRLGHALAGYALLAGCVDERLREQTDKLRSKPFRKRLLKEVKKRGWRDVTETFRDSLKEEGVSEQTAAELAESLR